MILQMNTMNLKNFREELARCSGSVLAILPDGTKCDVRWMLPAGRGNPTKMTLQIQRPGDYMRLACFAIGDV